MNQFPDDIWREAGLGDTAAALGGVPALMAVVEREYGAPRAAELLEWYVRERMPGGRLYLYGAGTHTRRMLDLLTQRPDIQVLGVIDRQAREIDVFVNLPVIAPEALPGRDFDYVVIGHASCEPEMRRRLLALGVPATRILTIYGDPALRRAAGPWIENRLAGLAGRRMDALIVNCASTALITDAALSAILPPDRTLGVYVGRPGYAPDTGVFPAIDLAESLDALRRVIAITQPKVIVVRAIIYKNFLGMAIKHWFPDLPVICEMYDYSVLWRDDDIEMLFGMDADSRRLMHASELVISQQAALCVSKRGGALWSRVQARCATPYEMVFPLACEPPAASGSASGTGRPRSPDIVYAGFLPSSSFLARFRNGYTFLPALEAVCRIGGLSGEIYNVAHAGSAEDVVFADYLENYADGPMRYFRRAPYPELLARMSGAGYGWLCDVQTAFQPDREVGVCNRWTGYVSAGLPVLLGAGWRFMADLARRFDAAIIVDDLTPEHLVALIRNADRPRLQAGAVRLRAHMLEHNRRAMGTLAGTLEQALTGR